MKLNELPRYLRRSSSFRVAEIPQLTAFNFSWNDPLFGQNVITSVRSGMRYLQMVHGAVTEVFSEFGHADPMELCRRCVQLLKLPPFTANPLVLRTFQAHKKVAEDGIELAAMFAPFLP